jgi:hypothetical protein
MKPWIPPANDRKKCVFMEQTDNEPNGSLDFSRKRDARAVTPRNPVKLEAAATRLADRAFD